MFHGLPMEMSREDVFNQLNDDLKGFGMEGLKVLVEEGQDRADVQKHTGQAVAIFRDVRCASRALAAMGGKSISGLKYWGAFEGETLPELTQKDRNPVVPSCLIEIDNLIPDLSKADLNERFKRYGAIVGVTQPQRDASRRTKTKTFARLEFEEVGSAEKAMSKMNGVMYCGETITVRYVSGPLREPSPPPRERSPPRKRARSRSPPRGASSDDRDKCDSGRNESRDSGRTESRDSASRRTNDSCDDAGLHPGTTLGTDDVTPADDGLPVFFEVR